MSWKDLTPPSIVYTVGRIARALDIPQATIEAWLRRDILAEFISEQAKTHRQFTLVDVSRIVFFHELRKAGLEIDFIKERMRAIGKGFAEYLKGGPPSLSVSSGLISVAIDCRYVDRHVSSLALRETNPEARKMTYETKVLTPKMRATYETRVLTPKKKTAVKKKPRSKK